MSGKVNTLTPLTVAPKAVLAADTVVAPVPPFAIANVPPNVTAPLVAVDGVNPVVPALKVETDAPIVWVDNNPVELATTILVPVPASALN